MLPRYKIIWQECKKAYYGGFVTTEATLQSLLFGKLGKEFQGVDVVAEPTWSINGGNKKPDLVVVQDGKITDILELKLEKYPKYEDDICKLRLYAQNFDKPLSARLDPDTIQQEKMLVSDECRLHFVAIACHDADAIDPNTVQERFYNKLPEEPQTKRCLYHWSGPVGGTGGNGWDVVRL